MSWRGSTTIPDRIFACLPYLLPIIEVFVFGQIFDVTVSTFATGVFAPAAIAENLLWRPLCRTDYFLCFISLGGEK